MSITLITSNGAAQTTGTTDNISTTDLIAGDTYDFLGVWNPSAIYENGATVNNQPTSQFEIVEYQGAFFLSNYYAVDVSPTQSGTYGAWRLINNIPANVTINNLSGPNYTLSNDNVGVPTPGETAPAPSFAVAVPFPVTNLAAGYTSASSVELFWSPSAVYGVGDVTSYSVYEVVRNQNASTSLDLLGTTTSTTFGVSGLAAATGYTFEIVATDANGSSGPGFVTNYDGSQTLNPAAPGAQQSGDVQTTSTATGHPTIYSSSIPNATVTVMTGSAGENGQHFSPYIDMTLQNIDLANLAQSSGLHDFTLAFMQTDKSDYTVTTDGSGNSTATLKANTVPNISFGGLSGAQSEPTGSIVQEVKAIEAAGGTVTISIGGYTGADPAVMATQYESNLVSQGTNAATAHSMAIAQLQSELQSVISTYGVNHLDFDIENDTPTGSGNLTNVVNNTAANSLRDAAIKGLEAANHGLSVSFTLATEETGLSDGSTATSPGQGQSGQTTSMPDPSVQNQLALVNLAAQDGVKISTINLMAMDFYDSYVDQNSNAGNQTGPNVMLDAAKMAAENAHTQVQAIATANPGWTAPLIGVTPMVGQNDDVKEVFTTADAASLEQWAAATPYIASLGEWELPRDQAEATAITGQAAVTQNQQAYNEQVAANSNSSGVVQTQYQFATSMNAIESYTPTTVNNMVTFNNVAAVTYETPISGSGGVEVKGAAPLTLTVAQLYTGKTQVYGELDLSGGGALGSSKAVVLKDASAVFDISGVTRAETILNLAGVSGSHIDLGANGLKVNQSTAANYSGVISDGGVDGGTGGSLTVKGTATLTLSGHNTFTGGLKLLGGEVELAASNAAGLNHHIAFTGAATLEIDAAALSGGGAAQSFTNGIDGFASGDTIDLASLAYVQGSTSATNSSGQVTVSNGTDSVTLTLYGINSLGLTTANDGHGGTLFHL